MEIYGHRARIGYASAPFVTEVFPYEFYRIAPQGVTLGITSLTTWEMTAAELDESMEITRRAAKEMARAGMNVVIFGGVPVNVAMGLGRLEELMKATEDECGIPVTSSSTAEKHALQALGARRVAEVLPVSDFPETYWKDHIRHLGYEPAGIKLGPYTVRDLGRVPTEAAFDLTRELLREHPEADTVVLGNSHWATVESIEALEQELKVNVISQSLVCIWEGLRRCNVMDPIPGFGRLFREH